MANESHIHTFRATSLGITSAQLIGQMSPDATVVIASQLPVNTIRIQLDADASVYAARKAELVAATLDQGWTLIGTDLPNVVPRTIYQSFGVALAADFSAVPADGWKTVLSQALVTRGTSALGIFASVNGDVSLGVGGTASARLFVAGAGWGAGTAVRGAKLTPDGPNAAFNHPLIVAPQGSDTTITIYLQVNVTALLSTITINPASDPDTSGAALAVVEYV